VRYVENVRNYYDILVWLTLDEREEPAETEDPLTLAGLRVATPPSARL
jgi:hypothetical protein